MKTQLCKKVLDSKCFSVVLKMFDTTDLLKLNLVSPDFYVDKIPLVMRTLKLNRLKYKVKTMLKTVPEGLGPKLIVLFSMHGPLTIDMFQ